MKRQTTSQKVPVDLGGNSIALRASSKPGALILGGLTGSLAAARSLGRHGIPVWFLTDGNTFPGFSRYVARTLIWKGPDDDDAADELVALAKRYGLEGWILLPGGDAEVRLVAQNHAPLSKVFRLTTPAWEVTQWADNKNLTYQLAQRVGVDVPKRYFPKDLDEVRRLECRFPVLLKPASHKATNALTLAKAWIAEDRAALIARYQQALVSIEKNDIVLQEMIRGDGTTQFSYAAVWHEGRPVAALVATRSRQYPMHVGYTSTFVEVTENATVTKAATRFLSAIAYSGPVEIEFKFDALDGTYKILDVNPRLWAWIGIGNAAGTDFVHILYCSTLGELISPTSARTDAAWVHLSRDVIAAIQEVFAGRLTAKRYFASYYRKVLTEAIFALDDPLPMLAELPITMFRVLTRRGYFAFSKRRTQFVKHADLVGVNAKSNRPQPDSHS